MTNHVKISVVAARWLISYAKQLVDDGFGVDYDPLDPSNSLDNSIRPGFLDDIPMENGQLWRYMNAVIAFARTVSAILARNMVNPTPDDFLLEDMSIFDNPGEL